MQPNAFLPVSAPLWSTLDMHGVLIGILGKPQQKMEFAALFSNSSSPSDNAKLGFIILSHLGNALE